MVALTTELFSQFLTVTVGGPFLILGDSIPKYVHAKDAQVTACRGDTVGRVTDYIRFQQIKVSGFSRILIHLGSNDISNLLNSGDIATTSLRDMLRRFVALRNSIRRRNSGAVFLFSSIIPRLSEYERFKPYIYGINFALEKWCAKTKGNCIFIPTFRCFLECGRPMAELYSGRDGLHLNGAGTDILEACFQQALSTGYLVRRLHTKRIRKLAALPY